MQITCMWRSRSEWLAKIEASPLPPSRGTIHMASCLSCAQGCETVDPLNITCPKYWQRPEGSNLCSQPWACGPMLVERSAGIVFLFVSLVYVRLIWYNYQKYVTGAEVAHRGKPPSGKFNLLLHSLKRVSPQTLARWIWSLGFAFFFPNDEVLLPLKSLYLRNFFRQNPDDVRHDHTRYCLDSFPWLHRWSADYMPCLLWEVLRA